MRQDTDRHASNKPSGVPWKAKTKQPPRPCFHMVFIAQHHRKRTLKEDMVGVFAVCNRCWSAQHVQEKKYILYILFNLLFFLNTFFFAISDFYFVEDYSAGHSHSGQT